MIRSIAIRKEGLRDIAVLEYLFRSFVHHERELVLPDDLVIWRELDDLPPRAHGGQRVAVR